MDSIMTYEQASRQLSLAEKVGQSFMPAAYINDSEESVRALEQLIKTNCIGGLCFFHSRASAATNFEGEKEIIYNEQSLDVLKKLISRYQNVATYPLLISIDAEWGLAMRIENTAQFPYAITLGSMTEQEELVFEVGKSIGNDCRNAGIHWNFAPVADVNNNPDNPVIGYRSFGEDPKLVARYSLAFTKGLQNAGVLTSAKHFPGHGDTATDSHLGLPVIDKTRSQLFENELVPFVELINKGVDSVMIGHLSIPELNAGITQAASVSEAIITGFLRKELGFAGVVVSDALNMHAVSKGFSKKGDLELTAYKAGTDILCYAENSEAAIHSILKQCSSQEIEEHFERVWRLKEKAMASEKIKSSDSVLSYSALMNSLATKSLSPFKGNKETLDDFKKHNLSCFTFPAGIKSDFLREIGEKIGEKCQLLYSEHTDEIESSMSTQDNLLLAIYPPSAKPGKNFGFKEEELEWIHQLVSNHRAILYLFGNPYVLNIINTELFEAIWVVYQDFPEFEANAARHFLGEVSAPGRLPVSIKMKVK